VTGRFLGKIPFACTGTLSAAGTEQKKNGRMFTHREKKE